MRLTYSTSISLLRQYIQNDDVAEADIRRLFNMGNARTRMAMGGLHKIRGEQKFLISDTDNRKNKYFLHPRAAKPVVVQIQIGGTKYPVWPVDSQAIYDVLESATLTNDQPTRYLYDGRAMEFYPTPTSEREVTVVYEEHEKELSNADYSTGTVVELVNNTKTVKFDGATISNWMDGAFIRITSDGFWYRIEAVDTTLNTVTLEQEYLGLTVDPSSNATDKAYTIGEQLNLPDELHEAPILWAADVYFKTFRRNRGMSRDFAGDWVEMITYAIGKYAPRGTIKVQNSKIRRLLGAINPNDFPNIPKAEL